MLAITYGSGFQMTFENGWTASVQFGQGNYCSTRVKYSDPLPDWNAPQKVDVWTSKTAEVAAWYGEQGMGMDNWYDFGSDQVKG